MRDPITKLAILDPSAIDIEIRLLLPNLFTPKPYELPVIHYASKIVKKTKYGFSNTRLLLVGSRHIFLYSAENGSGATGCALRHAIDIQDVSELQIFPDSFNVLRSREYDIVFKLQVSHEFTYFSNILQVIKWFLEPTFAKKKIRVVALQGAYEDQKKELLLSITRKQCHVDVTWIRNIDNRFHSLEEFLKPPPPPQHEDNAVTTRANTDAVVIALRHPLFQPPSTPSLNASSPATIMLLSTRTAPPPLGRRSPERPTSPTTLPRLAGEVSSSTVNSLLQPYKLVRRSTTTKVQKRSDRVGHIATTSANSEEAASKNTSPPPSRKGAGKRTQPEDEMLERVLDSMEMVADAHLNSNNVPELQSVTAATGANLVTAATGANSTVPSSLTVQQPTRFFQQHHVEREAVGASSTTVDGNPLTRVYGTDTLSPFSTFQQQHYATSTVEQPPDEKRCGSATFQSSPSIPPSRVHHHDPIFTNQRKDHHPMDYFRQGADQHTTKHNNSVRNYFSSSSPTAHFTQIADFEKSIQSLLPSNRSVVRQQQIELRKDEILRLLREEPTMNSISAVSDLQDDVLAMIQLQKSDAKCIAERNNVEFRIDDEEAQTKQWRFEDIEKHAAPILHQGSNTVNRLPSNYNQEALYQQWYYQFVTWCQQHQGGSNPIESISRETPPFSTRGPR